MSLVFELQLNKPVPKDMEPLPCVRETRWKSPTPRTMEERRAVLGCFLVTSMYVQDQLISDRHAYSLHNIIIYTKD